MPPVVRFHLDHEWIGRNGTKILAERLADLSPVLDEFIGVWAEGNVDKFDSAKGMEEAGVAFEAGVDWERLTPRYMTSKRKKYEDWLMVREGDLRESLIDRGGSDWFEEIGQDTAMFGSTDPKVGWHWEKRPVQFLSPTDRIRLQQEFFQYMTGGAKYGGALTSTAIESERMDAEFEMDVDMENT